MGVIFDIWLGGQKGEGRPSRVLFLSGDPSCRRFLLNPLPWEPWRCYGDDTYIVDMRKDCFSLRCSIHSVFLASFADWDNASLTPQPNEEEQERRIWANEKRGNNTIHETEAALALCVNDSTNNDESGQEDIWWWQCGNQTVVTNLRARWKDRLGKSWSIGSFGMAVAESCLARRGMNFNMAICI